MKMFAIIASTVAGLIVAFVSLGAYVTAQIDRLAASQRVEMDARFAAVDQQFAAVDQQFAAVNQQFAAVNQRFDAVDQQFVAVNQRFDDLDQRMDRNDQRLDRMENGLNDIGTRLGSIEALAAAHDADIDTLKTLVLPRHASNQTDARPGADADGARN